MSWFRKREPTVPLSAVEAIINATVAAMKAGGDISIDTTYPLRNADSSTAEEIETAVAEDGDFILNAGAKPEWEEDPDAEEEDGTD